MNLNNRVQLIGNVGANPIIKNFGISKKLARFSVATEDVVKKDGKLTKEVQWHIVVAWDKNAEISEKNIKKGTEVIIDGRLINRTYKDVNGEKRYITEVLADQIMYRHISEKQAVTNEELENQRA